MSQTILDKLAKPSYSYALWFDFETLYERLASTLKKLPAEDGSIMAAIEEKYED